MNKLASISNSLLMMLKKILRYGSIDLTYFCNSLYFFEKTLTKKLLPDGSLFKFVYKINNEWFSLAKNR